MTRFGFVCGAAGLAVALLSINLLLDRGHAQPAKPADTSAVVTIRDTIRLIDSASRRYLDSLREEFRRRPIRHVVDWLPGQVESVTVVESVAVPAPVVRATADSLATCWHDRDSIARSVALWQAREAAQREALDLCRNRPEPVQPDTPSRALWAGAGASAALLSVLSIFILSR